jgi:lipoprotein-anchoring transpeptidase ErfK/SrfK
MLALALGVWGGAAVGAAPALAQSPYYFWWSEGPPRGYKPYRQRNNSGGSQARTEPRRKSSPALEPSQAVREPVREKPKAAVASSSTVPALHSQLLTVISISDQKVAVYDANGVVDRGPVSTGQAGHRTPTGIFSIIQKNRYHRSNIYSGAPMPYMQRITWSGIAMHQGVLPGYPASHGCIRLSQSFAAEHFGRTKLGMRVVVSPEPTTAVEIAHPNLPVPAFEPGEIGGDRDPARSDAAATLVKVASAAEAGGMAEAAPVTSPMQRAAAAKVRAAAEVGIAAEAARKALARAAEMAAAAGEAQEALRQSEAGLAEARAEVAMLETALQQASNPEAAEHIRTTKAASEERLAEATRAMAEARAAEDARRSEAFAAARAAREAEKAVEVAEETAKASRKWTEPVSVFVSRKEGRVFVRQGFAPVLDTPVEIMDKETPLGTHLYVAMDTPDGGRTLRWSAVTVPNNGVAPERTSRAKKGEREEPPQRPRETAAGALSRVVLPEGVRKLVADKLWPGASIIISDYGTSNEQSAVAHTDFIVLTR